jgi:Putative enzyme of poly-gamma-glutamate biosynthesis (capsule formation)
MQSETKITFTGDMSFSAFFQKGYQKETLIDEDILGFCNTSDATIINYESPITPLKYTKKKRLAHRTDPEALDFIQRKFTRPIFSFANNHMMDYKSVGFIDSIEETEKRKIEFIGAGRNREEASKTVIIGNDVKVGVISLQYKQLRHLTKNFMGPLHESMIEDLQQRLVELRKTVDWIVLVYHGGDEFLYAPMPYTRKLIKKYLKMDIDVIVAHHPHVVQGYETINHKKVFYSLGNFIFDSTYQRAQEGTEQGMLVKLNFTKEAYTFNHLPIEINREQFLIEVGAQNPHFVEIDKRNYKKLWSYEAARKPQILENAKVLRKAEMAQIRETVREQKLAYEEGLKKEKYRQKQKELIAQGLFEEAEQLSLVTKKKRKIRKKQVSRFEKKKRVMKKVVRNLFVERQKNYRKWVLKVGRFRNRFLYGGRDLYQ